MRPGLPQNPDLTIRQLRTIHPTRITETQRLDTHEIIQPRHTRLLRRLIRRPKKLRNLHPIRNHNTRITMIRNQPHITRINNRLNQLIIHIRHLHPQERPIPNKHRSIRDIPKIRQDIRPLLPPQHTSQNTQQLTQLAVIIRIDRNELTRRPTSLILRRRLRQPSQRRQELKRNPSLHTHPRGSRQSLHSTLRSRRHMNLPPLQPRLPIPRRPPFPATPTLHQPPSRQLHRLQTPIRKISHHLDKRSRSTIKRRILHRTLKILKTHSHLLLPLVFQTGLTICRASITDFPRNQTKRALDLSRN